MTPWRPDERGISRRRAKRRLAGCALAAGLAVISPAAADDFSGRAILSEQEFSSGDIDTSVFDQLYELRFGRQISDPFNYLLFFRGEQSNGNSTVADHTSALRFTQLEPHAEATYTLPTIQLFGRWDLVDSRSKISGSPEDRRKLEHVFATFAFQPDRLPRFHFLAQRDHASSDTSVLDQTRTYFQGGLDFRWKNLLATVLARRSEFVDADNGLTRTSDGAQGSLVFEQTIWKDRLTVFANVLASYDRETDTTRSGAASGETPVTIFEALETIDDTPEDSRGNTGIPAPALIDGNLRTPTIIDVGPTGASFQNIAVDLRRFTDLDTFRIDIRDSGGNVVPRGEPVDFTVYTSTDGFRWTPIPGARTKFLPAESLYEVTFPKTIARLFKVVSFDLAPTDARVTEIRAFVHDRFAPSTTRTTDIKLGTANATVTFHPLASVTLFYYGLFNESREESHGRPADRTDDADQVASGSWDVTDRVNLLAQYQWRKVTPSGAAPQTYHALTADLRYTAVRNVSVTLEGISASQDEGSFPSEVKTGSLRTYLRLLRTVDFAANVGVQKQKFLNNGVTSDQWFVTGYSSVDLTSDLHLRLDGSYTRNGNDGLVGALVSDTDERYTGDFYYRPGPQLGIEVQVGWVRSGSLTGMIQNYRLDWRPFPFGSLGIGGRYEENVEPFTNRRSQRLIFDPHWRLNNHMGLDLNYTREKTTGTPRTDIFFAGFTLTM
jgi:hypothetical protein